MKHLTLTVLCLFLVTPAFSAVLTGQVDTQGPVTVIGTPEVDPVASIIFSVNDFDEPALIGWETDFGGAPVPVPVFSVIQNGTSDVWTGATLEIGSVLGGSFEISATIVTIPPLLNGLLSPPVILPAGPGTWSISNLSWAPTGFGNLSFFATIPEPLGRSGSGLLAYRFTPTPEPGTLVGLVILALVAGRRGQWSNSHSGTP